MTIEQFIEKHEGRRKKKYQCSAGVWTIGVGWNLFNPLPKKIAAYLKTNGEITDAMVDELLRLSIAVALNDCESLFPDFENFSDNRRMALIDFLFQLGKSRAKNFVHSIAMINTGRWQDAAENMRDSAWAAQVPTRAKEVTALIEEG
jgi:lysozyme